MKKEQLQHVGAIVFLLVCSYGVYYISNNINLLQSLFVQASTIQEETDRIDRDVLADIEHLKAINLDNTFFETPAYRVLADRSIVIDPMPLGAKEPFGDTQK